MNKLSSQKGFTLIEIIVAIGIFSVVALMGLSALLTMTNASGKAAATRGILDSIGFILEDISRTAASSDSFKCASNGSDCTGLDITDVSSGVTHYTWSETGGVGTMYKDDGDGPLPISPDTVDIDNVHYYVTATSSNTVARVQIIIQAKIGTGGKYQTPINLQTTVTSQQ